MQRPMIFMIEKGNKMDKLTDADGNITHVNGMTLRDYFAGQVIASVKGWHPADKVGKSAADIAYTIADAMLEARK